MKKFPYNYLLVDLSDDEGTGYRAVIPKFPKMHIYADTPQELHEIVVDVVTEVIKKLKEEGKKVPAPDKETDFNGRILLRISPHLHEELSLQAQANKISLNKYIQQKLQS